MSSSRQKRRSGNPARSAARRLPRRHPSGTGTTATPSPASWAPRSLTLLAGFLGPSAVTLTLGPRHSLLPPWYLPAGIVRPNEWFVSALIWLAILVGALGLFVGMRALADGWKPRVKRLFALGTG